MTLSDDMIIALKETSEASRIQTQIVSMQEELTTLRAQRNIHICNAKAYGAKTKDLVKVLGLTDNQVRECAEKGQLTVIREEIRIKDQELANQGISEYRQALAKEQEDAEDGT